MHQRKPENSTTSGYTESSVQVLTKQKEQWITETGCDDIAQEQPVALVYNGISHAVMMATPDDLEDFARGFSLSEGIVASGTEIYGIDVEQSQQGWQVHLDIASRRLMDLKARRRTMAGRTGCGLCGTESLSQAIRPVRPVPSSERPEPDVIIAATESLSEYQALKQITGATHAAAWFSKTGVLQAIREDVGRHNALDKLAGHLHKDATVMPSGFIVISSRASYEMVHKAAACGFSTLVAVSAPTALAVDSARQAGLNLIGFARNQRFIAYT